MTRIVKMLIATFAVIAMLILGHKMMSPMPIPAATTALGGLAALWMFRMRPTGALAGGAFAGALVGAAIHAFGHLYASSPHPHDGMMAHIATDTAIGVVIGLAVLCVPFAMTRIARPAVTE